MGVYRQVWANATLLPFPEGRVRVPCIPPESSKKPQERQSRALIPDDPTPMARTLAPPTPPGTPAPMGTAAALKPGETAPDRPADPGAPPVTTGEPAPAADTPAAKAWDLPCDEHYLPVFSVCEWASPWGELAGGLLVILPMLAMILACACVYPRSHEGYQQSGRLG